ncbi:thioredoxin domain-containing protein, partial [PVC group bacterium]|nr:thioredoxin domain-containing protein [PVC group bacterium]
MENQNSVPTRPDEATAEQVVDVSKGQNLMIPGAIILAGIIIAGAVVYSNGSASTTNLGNTGQAAIGGNAGAAENVKPVTKDDHIRGDINAPVTIVEFSDLQCPFCKRFHVTMKQIIENYDGKVAWVYRHFPLEAIHSRARGEAEGAECAAELGGNDAFWAFTDAIFEAEPNVSLADLPQIAESVGVNKIDFKTCLDERRYKDEVQADLDDATNSG